MIAENRFSSISETPHEFSDANVGFDARESGEHTIQRVLSTYEIGQKLRHLRLRKKIALVDLGRHTGLSASMLSQLETGKMVPTLPTLARIAMVFDVGLDYFFDDRRRRKLFTVVRKQERLQFPERPDEPSPAYFFECLAFSTQEKAIEAYLADFPERSPDEIRAHLHEGAEFVFVIRGELVINFHGQDNVLNQGDSVYFDATEQHSYRGANGGAQALVITTKPRT